MEMLQEKKKDEFVCHVRARLGALEPPTASGIHRVNPKLGQATPDDYRPCVVSIGPYHHGEQHLKAMEMRKWDYMLHLLHRPASPQNDHRNTKELAIRRSADCPRAVLGLDSRVRGTYSSRIELTEHQLAEIMVVDGCFILELLLRHSAMYTMENDSAGPLAQFDPILNTPSTISSIRRDLVLVENQIPLFVLETLWDVLELAIPSQQSLLELAFSFFFFDAAHVQPPSDSKEITHLLDIVRKSCLPSPERQRNRQICGSKSDHGAKAQEERKITISGPSGDVQKPIRGFHCPAKMLVERGIRIQGSGDVEQKRLGIEGMLDVSFDKGKGVLRIPTIRTDKMTASVLRNLVAMERRGPEGPAYEHPTPEYVTPYALVLYSLIKSKDDVDCLRQKGVLTFESVEEDPEALFQGLCEDAKLGSSYLSAVCREVREYDQEWWHGRKYGARALNWWEVQWKVLKDTYFPNTWKGIAAVFAVIFALLGLMQTIINLLKYLRDH